MAMSGRKLGRMVFLVAVPLLLGVLVDNQLRLATSGSSMGVVPVLDLEALLEDLLSSTAISSNRSSSTTTEHWTPADDTSLIIDIVSIGSKMRLDFQQAQAATFGRHSSVRYFFNITEDDDADPTCSDRLSNEDAYAISSFCKRRRYTDRQLLMKFWRNQYGRKEWLAKKAAPAGWMCAQTRPTHGLHTAVTKYRSLMQATSEPDASCVEERLTGLPCLGGR
jgi:hypothetical protein